VPGERLGEADVVVVHRDEVGSFLPPDGLVAKLVRDGGSGEELTFPVGVYFRPPPGRYRFWIEGDGLMTPFAARLPRVGELPSDMALVGVAPTASAGTVTVSGFEVASAPGSERRVALLKLGRYGEAGATRHELLRWIGLDRAAKGTSMPAGDIVAALWDSRRGELQAHSRARSLHGGTTAELELERPAIGAHLVLRAERSEGGADAVDEYDERIAVWQGEEAIAPDATAHAADSFYAFWYDLAPGPTEIEATWHGRYLDRTLDLASGQVATADGKLGERPSLVLELALPSELRADPVDLVIRSRDTGRTVATERWRPGRFRGRIVSLPPTRLWVELVSRFGPMREAVDLASGEDGYLLLEPSITVVRGTVRVGGEPRPASLELWTVDGAPLSAKAGADGRYEARALEPLGQISIFLSGSGAAPWTDFFPRALSGESKLDLDFPDVENRVRVLDARTREGIAGATVAFSNRYDSRVETPGARGGTPERRVERAVAQAIVTDDHGEAELPPLRTGTIELRAFAAGYRSLPAPLRLSVPDGTESQQFEILLESAPGSPAAR
jgi:hypothetical protein